MTLFGNTVRVRPFLRFEPRDLWVGVYWTRADPCRAIFKALRIYVCVVPLLPFGVVIEWHDAGWDDHGFDPVPPAPHAGPVEGARGGA